MNYTILIIFALLPSVIWLLFFLRKDAHPESNSMILKIFFLGMLSAIPAVFIELGFFQGMAKLNLSPFLISVLNVFLGIALVEEVLKYLVVRNKVLKSSEFDEPLDVMLYMIIAALGFVFFENLLIFLSPKTFVLDFGETLILSGFRFISATFLHALSSGAFGFFLALSFFETKKRGLYLFLGLSLATILHGLYNLSIIKIGESIITIDSQLVIVNYPLFLSFSVVLAAIFLSLVIFVSLGFKRLQKLKGICKIK